MPDHAEECVKVLALQPQPQIFAEDDRAELDRDERLEHVDQNDADNLSRQICCLTRQCRIIGDGPF